MTAVVIIGWAIALIAVGAQEGPRWERELKALGDKDHSR